MKAETKLPQPTFPSKTKKSIIYLLVAEVIVIVIFLWFHISFLNKEEEKKQKQEFRIAQSALVDEKMIQIRENELQLVKPLLLFDVKESQKLDGLKKDITSLIEMKKKTGFLTNASVYFRKLNDGSWTAINNEETYRPGSINKIPLMIYFLKVSEKQPGLLDKVYAYDRPIANPKSETYRESTMVLSKSYKVRELLNRMITQSDNIATTLLLMHMDQPKVYQEIFSELKMPVPQPKDFNFSLSVSDCSKFLRVLYNSTYLSEKNSQFALDLLSKSTFTNGLVRNLPKQLTVAHKFGESGLNETPEFSETGIVYDGNDTYLITIMTKGTDSQQQAEAISEISKLVYDRVRD